MENILLKSVHQTTLKSFIQVLKDGPILRTKHACAHTHTHTL